MPEDGNCTKFVVVQILVFFVIVTTDGVLGCEDENDLKTKNVTAAVGSSVELPCNVTNVIYSSWLQGSQTVVLENNVFDNKYSLSGPRTRNETSASYNVYNLIINDVTVDVEGLYSCQEAGCKKAKVDLFVEVPPVVWLEVGHSNITKVINVTLNKEVTIRCKAVGGKPSVSLTWEINGRKQIDGVSNSTLANGVSSTLDYRPGIDDRNVTCRTSGQIAVLSLSESVNINVLYPPTCHLLKHNDSSSTYVVTCVCVANPEVSSFEIYVNGIPHDYDNTVKLEYTFSAEIYCRAKNGVGSYDTPLFKYTSPMQTTPVVSNEQPKPQNGSPFGTIIIVVLSVAIVIIAVIVSGLLYHRRRKVSSSYFSWDSSNGGRTLSNRPPCPSPAVAHRITSAADPNYSYVPSHDAVVTNGLSSEKPKVTLDPPLPGEGDEYNLQYFQIPRCSTENMGNTYAVADSKEDEGQENGYDQERVSSCASSFSDEQYFRSSRNWDVQNVQEKVVGDNRDPYEWTEPDQVEPYEWAKPNKGKQKDENL